MLTDSSCRFVLTLRDNNDVTCVNIFYIFAYIYICLFTAHLVQGIIVNLYISVISNIFKSWSLTTWSRRHFYLKNNHLLVTKVSIYLEVPDVLLHVIQSFFMSGLGSFYYLPF
jgi:hypothetical protein